MSQKDLENHGDPEDGGFVDSTNSHSSTKKRKTGRLVTVALVILMIAGGWFIYQKSSISVSGPSMDPLNLIPADAMFILESDRPYDVWSDLGKTRLWDILQKDDEWSELGQTLAQIEKDLSQFESIFKPLTERKIYLSIHPYRGEKLAYLGVVDVSGISALSGIMIYQEEVTKRTFGENVIYSKYDAHEKQTLYFAFTEELLILSYNHKVLEKSLLEKQKATLLRSEDFLQINQEIAREGVLRFYINYNLLYSYLGSTLELEDIQELSLNFPFLYGGLFLDIENESMMLQGLTGYNDSISGYLKAFSESGTGSIDIAQVCPASTSVYISLGFSSLSKFYTNLSEQLSLDQNGKEYTEYISKTEKFLNIDFEDDVLGWIDDEVAVIQFQDQFGISETAMILKATDDDLALEKMDFLSKKIKRRTPIRFKTVDYKGYPINFMSVKGLFNILLGNLFKKYDRPYYAIIDEYVIFASRPQTLRYIIDTWVSQQTLARESSFESFSDQLGQKHGPLVYLQLPLLESGANALIDKETADFLKSKSNMFSSFPQMAFKISPSGEYFETKLLLSVNATEKLDPESLSVPLEEQTQNYDSLWGLDPGEQIELAEIEIEDLGADEQTEDFDNGQLKYEVSLKDGKKHGNYYEYYESGELKAKGKYRNDLKDGTWKYYDESGELIKKEKYRDGEPI